MNALEVINSWLNEKNNCSYFLSPYPEAGPYAIILFLDIPEDTESICVELKHNYGTVFDFYVQEPNVITVFTKE